MEFHTRVKGWFINAVKTNPKIEPALRDKILNGSHPAVDTLLKNLDQQVKSAQVFLMNKRGRPVDPKIIEGFVYDMTEVFCLGLQEKARRLYESDLARLERERKAQEIKDMEATLAGKPSGVYEEGGVLIDQTREEKAQTNQASGIF